MICDQCPTAAHARRATHAVVLPSGARSFVCASHSRSIGLLVPGAIVGEIKPGGGGETMSELLDQLRQSASEPESGDIIEWTDHGQEVVGTVLTRRWAPSDFADDGKVEVIDLETTDGIKALFVSPAILRRGIDQHNPQRGDVLYVRYERDEASGKGNPTKVFAVAVSKAAPEAAADAPF